MPEQRRAEHLPNEEEFAEEVWEDESPAPEPHVGLRRNESGSDPGTIERNGAGEMPSGATESGLDDE